MECPPKMRPSGERLRELRAGFDIRAVGKSCGVDWRTIAIFESGGGNERFQYNVLNALAHFYEVPFDSLLEPIPGAAEVVCAAPLSPAPAQASA